MQCYVFYREKTILNPEGQKEIIQFFPTCLPCSASIILPTEKLCRLIFNEVISEHLSVMQSPTDGSEGKGSAYNEGDWGLINPWVGKSPWRGEWLPTPVFLPKEIHGQRSLSSYSPWDCTESETTEWLKYLFWKEPVIRQNLFLLVF